MRLMINVVIIFIVILYTITPYPVIITFITSPASFFVWVLLNQAVLQCMKLNEMEERGEEREKKKRISYYDYFLVVSQVTFSQHLGTCNHNVYST